MAKKPIALDVELDDEPLVKKGRLSKRIEAVKKMNATEILDRYLLLVKNQLIAQFKKEKIDLAVSTELNLITEELKSRISRKKTIKL